MNELLEKRKSHGMDYFGKDNKLLLLLLLLLLLFFFSRKKFTYETLENTKKCFLEIFFKNATKHHKIFSRNYFPFLENIFRKLFYVETNTP